MVDGNQVHRGPHEPVTPLAVPTHHERPVAVAPPAVHDRVRAPRRPDRHRMPAQRTGVVVGLTVGQPAAPLGPDRVHWQLEPRRQQRQADEQVVVVRIALDPEHDPSGHRQRVERVTAPKARSRARPFR